MNEYEYNQMLDDIAWALDDSTQDNMPSAQVIRLPPRAANDNGLEWPLLPFPDDFIA
ncbi:hypothetical protein BJ122_101332 [Rhodopseudomonas faecalis]|uniref:Uncharacterized protein n=1 Tax=Rhodopseudomonas faecalis TaxID=99655 RepID=A0A318TNW2_9BRAD|nr:hypothetical protein [Rhodopseudomonas faecalis]PYF05587.1 hypothetical protein BJ122_101332 [Rhodopseudomonas faecalis]